MNEQNENICLTVVIPFYNEEGSLLELHKRISEAVKNLGVSEFIFIDDGSTDSSNSIIRNLKETDNRIRLLTLRRNQGKSTALALGFQYARGNYVVTMDADLQDDPAEIPGLISELESGYDMVSGWKKKRHDPLSKTMPSKVFNRTVSMLSGISLHDFNCGLKIYRSEVVKNVSIFGERHRFIPVLAHMQGFKVGEKAVLHHPRVHGKTKFGAYRYIAGFFDLITLLFRMKFVSKPLHFFGSLGMISLLGGFGILLYLTIGWFYGHWIGNRPLLQIGVLGVVTGIQLFTLGLLAEMIAERSSQQNYPLREDSDIDPAETE